jgi:hypothetical protein
VAADGGRVAIRGTPRCRTRPPAAARGSVRAHALSPSRHWGWARVVAVPRATVQQEPGQGASLRFAAADESRAVIHAFAAIAMNTEHRGVTL